MDMRTYVTLLHVGRRQALHTLSSDESLLLPSDCFSHCHRPVLDTTCLVTQNMCNSNGTSCTLDINHPALNSTGPNDVLKVLWRCSW
jgi:hypothetical protein